VRKHGIEYRLADCRLSFRQTPVSTCAIAGRPANDACAERCGYGTRWIERWRRVTAAVAAAAAADDGSDQRTDAK